MVLACLHTRLLKRFQKKLLITLILILKKLVEIIETAKDNTFELMQVMLLHMDPGDLQRCDNFNGHKSFDREKVLLFNTDIETFSAYEVMLKQLNYDMKVSNNMFMLPDCKSFKAIILHFADAENLANDVALLKKIQKQYGNKNPNLCIIADDDVVENMKSYKKLDKEIFYLIKPISIKMVLDSIDKIMPSEKSIKLSV